jgi:hypothetical protein
VPARARLLLLGRLDPRKGVDTAIDACVGCRPRPRWRAGGDGWAASANLAITREAFAAVGDFDPAYARLERAHAVHVLGQAIRAMYGRRSNSPGADAPRRELRLAVPPQFAPRA